MRGSTDPDTLGKGRMDQFVARRAAPQREVVTVLTAAMLPILFNQQRRLLSFE